MGIFEPFRAIGYITAGGVPFSVQRLGSETFVTVSVGKAFHVYNVSRHPTSTLPSLPRLGNFGPGVQDCASRSRGLV